MSSNSPNPLVCSSNNHLQPSYGVNKTAIKTEANDVWNFQMGGCRRPAIEFRTELQVAAQEIWHHANKETVDIYVDGSYASQMLIQAFKWSGVSVRGIVPRFNKDLNIHSVSQAIVSLENHEIPYQIENVDVENFLASTEAIEWGVRYRTDQANQLVGMKIWDSLKKDDRFLVFPFGLPHFEKTNEGWSLVELENLYALYRFQNDHNLKGIPHFFKWSPELTVSFCQNPLLRKIVTHLHPTNSISPLIQKEIFQTYFPLIGNQDWHGFEKLEFPLKSFFKKLEQNNIKEFTAYTFTYADLMTRITFKQPAPREVQPAAPRNETNISKAG